MARKIDTLIVFDDGENIDVHLEDCGCKSATKLRKEGRAGNLYSSKHRVASEEELIKDIFSDLNEDEALAMVDEIKLAPCVRFPTPSSRSKSRLIKNPKTSAHPDWDAERLPTCDDKTYALAVRVREMREQREPWWRIGHVLELKGSGPSAASGKTGAAGARRLWEKAWGHTYQSTEAVRESLARKKERAVLQPGKPFFAPDISDNEILAAVTGRRIFWNARVGGQSNGAVVSPQEAVVSPIKPRVVLGPKGRVLEFYDGTENYRTAGPRRSVYVDRIEKVSK